MTHPLRRYILALLSMVVAVGILAVSFLAPLRLPIPKPVAKPVGVVIALMGMGLILWAAAHLGRGLRAVVEPGLEVLVQDGPYRFVRPPVYLRLTIALFGSAPGRAGPALRSGPGLVGTFCVFLPIELYRARLEEKALARKFGEEWKDYAARTGFLWPWFGKT